MLQGGAKPVVQAKLTVNEPGDIYEQEADAMADRVMRMSSNETVKPVTGLIGSSLQRKCSHCEEEEKKRKPVMRKEDTGSGGMQVSSSFASSLNASKGGGSPLPHGTRRFMESAFSTDFSGVRVHTGGQASQMSKGINAKAFTHGNDIYFDDGQYNIGSDEGKNLLAHELTHTLQQSQNIMQRSVIQRYPWPYPLHMRQEVDERITETISGAPAGQSAWNNTFSWDSRFRIEINAVFGEIRLIVRLNTTAPAATRRAWEAAVQRKWSDRMYLKITIPGISEGPCKFPIIVDLRWTSDASRAHYTINPQGAGGSTGGRAGLGGTSSMTDWGTADTTDITHEFGHMIGNRDEYFITNGTNYMTGGGSGFRDPGGGIMNNPAERIHRRHFNSLRQHVATMLGLRNSAVRVMYDNESIPDCTADIGDFPEQVPAEGEGTAYA